MTHIISCDINLKGIFVSVCSIIPIVFCTIWTKVLQGLRGHGHLCQITIVKPADGVTLRCFGWSTGQDFPTAYNMSPAEMSPTSQTALSVRRSESKIVIVYRVRLWSFTAQL